MVEKEEVTGSLNRGGGGGGSTAERLGTSSSVGVSSPRFDGNKLYADYLKREGKRPTTTESQGTSASARERREVDEQFRDF